MKTVLLGARPMMLLAALAFTLVGCTKETTGEVKAEAVEPATAEVKPYPLDICVVEEEKLGSMGDPYVFVHEGQELKLCCKGCLEDFEKEPAKYLEKLKAVKKS